MTAPACPITELLDRLLPSGLSDRLSAAELGAAIRLIQSAWRQDPPCTLDGRESSLAAFAGLTASQWGEVRERVLLAFQPGPGDRVTAPAALRTYDELRALAERRAAAGRASGDVRRRRSVSRRSTPAEHVLNTCSNAAPAPSESSNPPALALSAQRSLVTRVESSAPQQSAGDAQDGSRSAGRGAPETPIQLRLRLTERSMVVTALEQARWPWAGDRHNRLPPNVIERLSRHPNATLRQVRWAIAWANRLQSEPDQLAQGRNPVGRVIGAVERNVQPDLWWRDLEERHPHPGQATLDRLRADLERVTGLRLAGGSA